MGLSSGTHSRTVHDDRRGPKGAGPTLAASRALLLEEADSSEEDEDFLQRLEPETFNYFAGPVMVVEQPPLSTTYREDLL